MLALTHEGKPGLPRGRSHLPPPAVSASQRERLLRSVIAAVSERGYQAVTVADIVRRARGSKKAFYDHFANKEECFLAATGEGRDRMIARVVSASRALPAGADDEDLLRAAVREFLAFLADEPAFARVFYIHMPAAGPRAASRLDAAPPPPGFSPPPRRAGRPRPPSRLDAAPRRFAELNRRWHERARERHPDWPAVSPQADLALARGTPGPAPAPGDPG